MDRIEPFGGCQFLFFVGDSDWRLVSEDLSRSGVASGPTVLPDGPACRYSYTPRMPIFRNEIGIWRLDDNVWGVKTILTKNLGLPSRILALQLSARAGLHHNPKKKKRRFSGSYIISSRFSVFLQVRLEMVVSGVVLDPKIHPSSGDCLTEGGASQARLDVSVLCHVSFVQLRTHSTWKCLRTLSKYTTRRAVLWKQVVRIKRYMHHLGSVKLNLN